MSAKAVEAAVQADAARLLAGIRPILERARTLPLTREERALLAELVAGLRELYGVGAFFSDSQAEEVRALLGEGRPGH